GINLKAFVNSNYRCLFIHFIGAKIPMGKYSSFFSHCLNNGISNTSSIKTPLPILSNYLQSLSKIFLLNYGPQRRCFPFICIESFLCFRVQEQKKSAVFQSFMELLVEWESFSGKLDSGT